MSKYKLGDRDAEKFSLLIYVEDYEKAVKIAKKNELSTSAFIRLALSEKLANYEKQKNNPTIE